MRTPTTLALLLTAALLGACAADPLVGRAGSADLALRVQVQGGYALQTVLSPYTSTSIDHLVVKLFTVANSVEQAVLDAGNAQVYKDVPGASLGAAIVFSQLKPATTYRIKASAYKAPGTAPADLISSADAYSQIDVTLTANDRPTIASLPVKLIDRPFNGQATASSVVVTEGGYAASGSVAVTPL